MDDTANTDDEIDLLELFAALAAQKLLIAAVSTLIVLVSGFYAFRIAEPAYTAETVFSVARESGPTLPSSAEGLAALAGFDLGGGDSPLVFERLEGRDFILSTADPLGLRQDPAFNPALASPSLLTRLVESIRGTGAEPMTDAKIDEALVRNFRERVNAGETENGATKLTVTHPDAERAAFIANETVERLFAAIEADEVARARRLLGYYSDQLLEVQSDLDAALAAAQDFAVRSNIASEEELARKSAQLVNLRENRSAVVDQLEALRELDALMQGAGGLSDQEVRELQTRMPVAESAEFLRSLGAAAIQDDWDSLSADDLETARSALSERLQRIERSILALRSEAEETAEQASESARLQRDVKIEQATYDLVLEQFRRTSFASGFEDATGEIYSRAAPPLEPSEPRTSLILALGLVLGLVSGSGLALVRMNLSGRLYTQRSLREALRGQVSVVEGQFLHRLAGRDWPQLSGRAAGIDDVDAAEFCFSIQDLRNEQAGAILLTALETSRQMTGLAALLTDRLAQSKTKVLLVDIAGALRAASDARPTELKGVQRAHLGGNCDLYQVDTGPGAAGRNILDPGFRSALRDEVSGYDLVIYLLPPLSRGKYFVEALGKENDVLVAVARLSKARRRELDKLSLLARQGSMHTYLVTLRR